MSNTVRVAARGALITSLVLAPLAVQAAAPTVSSEGVLEEITVTAQYHAEKLQNTPIAITAITAAGLEERNLSSITDVGAFVPSTIIAPLGAGWGATMAAYIRGIGLGDNSLSFEPGVPIYVDDVYIGRPQGAMLDLLDLEQVEVLRGPQGTLFGKNAEGGTVRMMSTKPQGDDSGSFSATFGNLNRMEARGMADVSLIDNFLSARFSFSSKRADGYFTMIDYVCKYGAGSLGSLPSSVPMNSNCVAGHSGNENTQSGRAAFRFTFSDAVELNVIADMTVQNEEGPADKYTIISTTQGINFGPGPWGPNGNINASYSFLSPQLSKLGLVTAGPAQYIGLPVGYDSRFITNSPYTSYGNYGVSANSGRNIPNENDMNHWGLSGSLSWKLDDNMTLKAVTAYRTLWNNYGRDSDGSPLDVNATYDQMTHRQFTEEVTLTGLNFDNRFNWAVGGFYYNAYDTDADYDDLYTGGITIQNADTNTYQTTESWAFFGHGGYKFTDQFSVSGGVRYTSDRKDATVAVANLGTTVGDFNTWIPLTSSHVDYDLSLNYQWDRDLMTYIKYSTGFKGGGFSPRPSNALQTEPFKPEYLKTLEIGEKSEFLDNRIRLNTDFYYSRYINVQSFADQLDPSGANWFREENAGTARVWGIEGELQAEPIQDLRFDASFGYLNWRLLDNGGNALLFTGDQCGGQTCEGERTPKYTAALGAQYSWNFTSGKLTPRLDATYQSTIYFADNNGCFALNSTAGCGTGAQGGYTLLNGRLTWATLDKKWDVSLWGRNLTNKAYFSGKLSLITFFGREQGNVAPPMEFGVTFKRNFKFN